MTARKESDSLYSITQDLEQLLHYEQSLGQRGYDVSPDTLEALKHVSPATTAGPADSLDLIRKHIQPCKLCPLHSTRNHTVPGQGSAHPELVFIGEGPGADEDACGEAFVGKAGQLLTKMIIAMGFTRDEVWIGNMVKCRPPENRKPLPEEMTACMPYLQRQLALLQPRVIVCLGATAAQGLLQTTTGITRLRGNWMKFGTYDVMPTFHPAFLLRDPSKKKPVWEDLKAVLDRLGRPVPQR